MTTKALTTDWSHQAPTKVANGNLLKLPERDTSTLNAITSSKYFAVDQRSSYVPSFRLIRRDDSFVSFSYRCIPIIEFQPDSGIYLNMARTSVFITGQNLEVLAEWLGRQRVIWIKESKTGYAIETDDIFVQNIRILRPDNGE